jgi:hypothetical protein
MTQPPLTSRDAELDSSAPAPKPEKASLFDDFMDIFYAPSAVYARRANASFWVPLIIISVLAGVIFIANRDLMEPIMEAEMARAMAKSAAGGRQMTPEQLEAGRKIGGIFATIGAFVFTPITILLLGLVTWLVGKFVDAKQTLNAATVVTTFAFVPRLVEGIVARVQGLFVDPSTLDSRYSLTLGLGRFLDPDTASPMLLALVGRIDVFTIWVTVLIAIGLAVTGKISRGRAAIGAAIVWLVGALPTIAGALQ